MQKKREELIVETVAMLYNVERRQVPRLVRQGKVPGARKAKNGYHNQYFDTAGFRHSVQRRLARETRNQKRRAGAHWKTESPSLRGATPIGRSTLYSLARKLEKAMSAHEALITAFPRDARNAFESFMIEWMQPIFYGEDGNLIND